MPSSRSFASVVSLQRVEGVAHDGQLVRLGHPDRLLREARAAGPCGMPDGCSVTDPTSIPFREREVAVDVIDHLLRVQVRVVVRDRDRQRVEVELARAERADHEVPALEGLVRGRRHVDAAGDRLEVVDRERPRVDVAVPADDVERVVVEHVGLVAVLDAHLDVVLARARDACAARSAGGCRGGSRARARAAARTRSGSGAGSRSGPVTRRRGGAAARPGTKR